MDGQVHFCSSSPTPCTNAHAHIPSYICPLLRSHKDEEGRQKGVRAVGKQTGGGWGCFEMPGQEGSEGMVGRRVERAEQRLKV